jgi:hypothetical protein
MVRVIVAIFIVGLGSWTDTSGSNLTEEQKAFLESLTDWEFMALVRDQAPIIQALSPEECQMYVNQKLRTMFASKPPLSPLLRKETQQNKRVFPWDPNLPLYLAAIASALGSALAAL